MLHINKMHVTIKRHFHVTESFVNRSIRLISSRTSCTLCCTNGVLHRSQWPRGIRQGSSALRLLGLRLRIPPGTWMSASCECFPVEVSASGSSPVQRSPTERGVSKCDLENSTMRRPYPTLGCRHGGGFKFLFTSHEVLV